MTTVLCILVVVLTSLGATAPEARAATPTLLLGGTRVGQFQPIRGDNFLAWQQNTRREPGHYDVYARPLGGGDKFRVNPPDKNGANGGIDGDRLVYQQFSRRKSNLRFFDLVQRVHRNPPPGVNTVQWEYWPSMSGQWLLFGRLYGNGVRRIILFDLSTGNSRILDKLGATGSFLAPGKVNGDFAVWYECVSASECNVFRYHIPDGAKVRIPNPGGSQYSPSVTREGTVYFARSRAGCGTGVRLLRQPLEGEAVVLWRLPSGDDISSTNVSVDAQGINTVLFDQFACGQPAVSDVWEIVEDDSPELTVTVEGDGSGTVTSNPAGIDCGADCQQHYDAGTDVTLTASADLGSVFVEWTGCDVVGVDNSCTVDMTADRTVTAAFDDPLI